jgi:predicted phosphoribosyltransferase
MRFRNRTEAGNLLGAKLSGYRGQDAVVLALPRGGVPVGKAIADALDAPLDVIVARKIGAPGNEEFALGAVTARGARVLNEPALRRVFLPPGYLNAKTEEQRAEAARRERVWRGIRPAEPLAGRTAILVDDGIATGMTMRAAIVDARVRHPARLIVAAPVIAPDTYDDLLETVDDVVALAVPAAFMAVGAHYDDFTQVTDDEALAMLAGGGGPSRSGR